MRKRLSKHPDEKLMKVLEVAHDPLLTKETSKWGDPLLYSSPRAFTSTSR